MTRRLRPPLLVVLLLWPACQLQAAPPATAVLAGVPGLERPVTLSETKIPVGELLERIDGATGVHLVATGPAADEPVAVVVTDMPAVRLLEELATFLDYRWAREDPKAGAASSGGARVPQRGYRLYQDAEQLKRERTLFAQARQNEQERLRATIASYAQVGKLSDTEFAAARDLMQRSATQSAPLTPAEARSRRTLQGCDNDARRAMARLLGELTGNDWTTLQAGRSLRFYSRPAAGERALPQEVVQRLNAFRPSATAYLQQYAAGEGGLAFGDTLEHRREYVQEQDDAWARAASLRVTVRMYRETRSTYRVTAPILDIDACPLGGNGDLRARSESKSIWIDPVTTQPGWGDDPPERQAELERDPVLNRQKPFHPVFRPLRTMNRAQFFGLAPHFFPEMARTYGVSLLADSYDNAPIQRPSENPGEPGPEASSLRAAITRLGGNYYRVERHDDLVLLRSRSWFYDRAGEIPLRMVRHWNELRRKFGCLPLREYLEAARSLSNEQCDTLWNISGWDPLMFGYSDLPSNAGDRDGFRLLGLLNLKQRQRLERGEAIPLTELNAVQRNQCMTWLDADDTFRPALVTPADLATAYIQLDFKPGLLFLRNDPDNVVYRYAWLGKPDRPDPLLGPPVPPDQQPVMERFPIWGMWLQLRCGSAEVAAGSVYVAP